MDNKNLRKTMMNWGASLVGIANMKGFVPRQWQSLTIGISVAVRLSDEIINEIKDGPTLIYAYHYSAVNQQLDSIALKTSNLLQTKGYHAVPIPASQTINQEAQAGIISHKLVATRAGLGWIGRNALLITHQYGPRVRLVSILTDAPLPTADPIIESRCGDCLLCVRSCPVKALKGKNWTPRTKREELLEVDSCHQVIEQNKTRFGAPICGICVSVCPIKEISKSK